MHFEIFKQIKNNKKDYIIIFAVMIQSLLLILQTVMINVWKYEPEQTTIYRVSLTAIPMVCAIWVAATRNLSRVFFSFAISIIVLILHAVMFPENAQFIYAQGTRFLLPVVIPSLVCLSLVSNIQLFEKGVYVISWISTFFILYYVYEFFKGTFFFNEYNMPFSYACLLPMTVLYSHRKIYDITASILIFFVVLSIGCRGAALYFIAYVVLDLLLSKSKYRYVAIFLAASFILVLPNIGGFLDSIGISSRTLNMFASGEIGDDSGRDAISNLFFNMLLKNPIVGLGLFGDRAIPNVPYCHNIFLEILLNFGLLFGTLIIMFLGRLVYKTYVAASDENRNKLIRYFCALFLPFLTSDSYLISSGFAIFLGICILIKNNTYRNERIN